MIKTIGIALAVYQPEISVLIEQLKSIQEQTWKNWICIITCDSALEPIFNDSQMRLFREDYRFVWIQNLVRLGHKKNFEKAIQTALSYSVDAIACSDQDDIWYPEKLSVSVQALEKAGPLSLVHCDMHVFRNGVIEPKTAWEIERRGVSNVKPEHLLIRNVVAGCSMLFDAKLAQNYLTIPDGVDFHDHWYALVASFHGGVHAISCPLYAYRQHGKNEVGVSPYVGLFAIPSWVRPCDLLSKFVMSWKKTRVLAESAWKSGLPLSALTRLLYLSRIDFGVGFLFCGFLYIRNDPALARAYFKRMIGKALSLLGLM